MYRRTLPLPQRLSGITRSAPASRPPAPPSESILAERARAAQDAADGKALNGMLESLTSIIENARKKRQSTMAELAQQSVELGVAIAERLLGAGIRLDRQRLDQIVLTSLERLPTSNAVVLRGHPEDIVLLQRQTENNALLERWSEALTLQHDQTCERGRLILEADDLFVEWDTQRSLVEMRSLLLDQIFTES